MHSPHIQDHCRFVNQYVEMHKKSNVRASTCARTCSVQFNAIRYERRIIVLYCVSRLAFELKSIYTVKLLPTQHTISATVRCTWHNFCVFYFVRIDAQHTDVVPFPIKDSLSFLASRKHRYQFIPIRWWDTVWVEVKLSRWFAWIALRWRDDIKALECWRFLFGCWRSAHG